MAVTASPKPSERDQSHPSTPTVPSALRDGPKAVLATGFSGLRVGPAALRSPHLAFSGHLLHSFVPLPGPDGVPGQRTHAAWGGRGAGLPVHS